MKGKSPKADLDMLIAECFDMHSGTLPHLDVHDAIMQVRSLYSLVKSGRRVLQDAKAYQDLATTPRPCAVCGCGEFSTRITSHGAASVECNGCGEKKGTKKP